MEANANVMMCSYLVELIRDERHTMSIWNTMVIINFTFCHWVTEHVTLYSVAIDENISF